MISASWDLCRLPNFWGFKWHSLWENLVPGFNWPPLWEPEILGLSYLPVRTLNFWFQMISLSQQWISSLIDLPYQEFEFLKSADLLCQNIERLSKLPSKENEFLASTKLLSKKTEFLASTKLHIEKTEFLGSTELPFKKFNFWVKLTTLLRKQTSG